MDDDDLEKLLAEYVGTENPEMAGVELDLNEGHGDAFGAEHALIKHGVSADEIAEVLFELEAPEEKRSTHEKNRTMFWGHTRKGRRITVVCTDVKVKGTRRLGLITAFPESEADWRRRR